MIKNLLCLCELHDVTFYSAQLSVWFVLDCVGGKSKLEITLEIIPLPASIIIKKKKNGMGKTLSFQLYFRVLKKKMKVILSQQWHFN